MDPQMAIKLSDARRQLHHAAQLATAAGISYLPHQSDDRHTNLEWLEAEGMLASNVIPGPAPFRVAVRAVDLRLVVLDGENTMLAALPLDGRTIANAATWLRLRLAEVGIEPERYTLERHYKIPHHPVDDGAAFDTTDVEAFEQLAEWFAAAAVALEGVRAANPGASDVRCWPHHFDIATLIDVSPGKTIGVGMEPGDQYYDEPYFYVNVHPQPASVPTTPLGGGGTWHSHEWIGAVLRGSRLSAGTAPAAIEEFLESAIEACRTLSSRGSAATEGSALGTGGTE